MSGQVLLIPDHFCIVSDQKFSSQRHDVSPAADSYNWPCVPVHVYVLRKYIPITEMVRERERGDCANKRHIAQYPI